MAWFDPTSITFDLDKITDMQTKVDNIATELETLSSQLTQEMDLLKETWKTPAGKKFWEDYNDGWKNEVEKYIATIETLHSILSAAATAYGNIEQEAKVLKF